MKYLCENYYVLCLKWILKHQINIVRKKSQCVSVLKKGYNQIQSKIKLQQMSVSITHFIKKSNTNIRMERMAILGATPNIKFTWFHLAYRYTHVLHARYFFKIILGHGESSKDLKTNCVQRLLRCVVYRNVTWNILVAQDNILILLDLFSHFIPQVPRRRRNRALKGHHSYVKRK